MLARKTWSKLYILAHSVWVWQPWSESMHKESLKHRQMTNSIESWKIKSWVLTLIDWFNAFINSLTKHQGFLYSTIDWPLLYYYWTITGLQVDWLNSSYYYYYLPIHSPKPFPSTKFAIASCLAAGSDSGCGSCWSKLAFLVEFFFWAG